MYTFSWMTMEIHFFADASTLGFKCVYSMLIFEYIGFLLKVFVLYNGSKQQFSDCQVLFTLTWVKIIDFWAASKTFRIILVKNKTFPVLSAVCELVLSQKDQQHADIHILHSIFLCGLEFKLCLEGIFGRLATSPTPSSLSSLESPWHTHNHQYPAQSTHTHRHTHTIAETLFSNHAKPLGPTIQAGPNLIALDQSEGWKLESGIDWPVATGASKGKENKRRQPLLIDNHCWLITMKDTFVSDLKAVHCACVKRKR